MSQLEQPVKQPVEQQSDTGQENYTTTPSTTSPIVEVKDLCIDFDTALGRKRVVNMVNFHVNAGEILGILGESGSGKTMSTQAVLGLIDGIPGVMHGEINLYHHNTMYPLLAELSNFIYTRKGQVHKKDRAWQKHIHRKMKNLWGHAVTAIFQNPRNSLDPLMTVGQQLIESLQTYHQVQNHTVDKDQLQQEAISWLNRVQMTDASLVFHAYPHELSGGMCQRAMIAVALACQPKLLIADEPTTGLDATVRAQIVMLLQQLVQAQQCAMLYISHDIREILFLTHRVIVMKQGQILEQAHTIDVKEKRGQRHAYTQTLLNASGLLG
jgi:peptide/nickel transport system ATP-binding protein